MSYSMGICKGYSNNWAPQVMCIRVGLVNTLETCLSPKYVTVPNLVVLGQRVSKAVCTGSEERRWAQSLESWVWW